MIEPLLLTTTLLSAFCDRQGLTAASGFFFERDQRLYLVTSRHVLIDKPSGHFPNCIELTLHTDVGGEIDVAVIELDRAAMPPSALIRSFTPAHLPHALQEMGGATCSTKSCWG